MGTAPNGYQTPKTDWAVGNIPIASDFNRIEGNSKAIEEGQRTIDPAQAPSGLVGTLRNYLDWFANRIKAITGKTNWYDAPTKSLEQLNTDLAAHLADNVKHITSTERTTWNNKLDASAYTASDVLTKIKTVDLLDGQHGSYYLPASSYTAADVLAKIKTVDGAGSGLDADTVDGKHASDFMSAIKVYGNVTYTDSIAASSKLTKTIALGGNYKHGKAVIYANLSPQSIIVFFGIDNTKTLATGVFYDGSTDVPGAWSRRKFGYVTYRYLGSGRQPGAFATGNGNIGIDDIYISATNLTIIFNNYSTSAQSLNCVIDWEVW